MPRTVGPVVPPGTMREREQPVLPASEDARLRPWVADDAPAVLHAFSDPDIRYWHARRIDSEDEAGSWIRAWKDCWHAESDASWAVTENHSDDLLGYVALRHVLLAAGVAEITYWVVPAARRRGLATSAVRALSTWAMERLGLHRLTLEHSVRNERSCRVAERAGFTLEGTLRAAMLHADGWHDMHLHALVASR